jgi:multidrug efflux pump subunit AcrA (membrane-fusion protein)
MNRHLSLAMAIAAGLLIGCESEIDADVAAAETAAHDQEVAAMAAGNRIAIPSAVRRNLGISFVTVERRRIENTLRVPGQFEYLPSARKEHRTMLPGRVELLVEQFERVEAGDPLYRIESPAWREMQQELAASVAAIDQVETRLSTFEPLWAAHERHEASLEESIAVWRERVEQLESVREAGGGRINELAEARSALASARAELANVQEKKAEIAASREESKAELASAKSRLEYLLDSAAAIMDETREAMSRTVDSPDGPEPRWAIIDEIEVRATKAGVVEQLGLTDGSWADQKTAVLTLVQPDRLRFHASGLQSDLGVLHDGLPARIVPPTPTMTGRAVPLQDTMEGELRLGLAGDARDRTIELYVVPDELKDWARPGVSAQLEIVTDATAHEEIAIPLAAVQRDGLTPVIFRRAPDNPNEAIRIEADLGADDGRWVALLSGVRDGDEIVLDGAFQLMLATSGSIQKGGHFHADGTYHEGEH